MATTIWNGQCFIEYWLMAHYSGQIGKLAIAWQWFGQWRREDRE
jgi:hypothetical protein